MIDTKHGRKRLVPRYHPFLLKLYNNCSDNVGDGDTKENARHYVLYASFPLLNAPLFGPIYARFNGNVYSTDHDERKRTINMKSNRISLS